jgi:hypothetical protein
MKKVLTLTSIIALLYSCNLLDSTKIEGDLAQSRPVIGVLETETPDSFYLDIPAETFIYGIVDQISVDVVVTFYDSADNVIGRFDGPGVGPEPFTMEIEEAGNYLLEVAPFEEDTGDYSLELIKVERIATDPVKRLDQLFSPYSGEEVPGGVVCVYQDG